MTALVYRFLGLAADEKLASIFGYVVSISVFIVALKKTANSAYAWPGLVLVFVYPILAAVYLAYYSKDVVVAFVILCILMVGDRVGKKYDVFISGVILLYGIFVRQYWILLAAVYLLYRFVRLDKRNAGIRLTTAIVTAAVLSYLIWAIQGVSPDYFRTSVNEYRVGSDDASSMITRYVDLPDPLGGVANIALTLVFLVAPVPLLSLGGAYYFASFCLFVLVWVPIFLMPKGDSIPSVPEAHLLESRCFALLVGFLTVQALFEPDYGSALRHVTPLIPCVFILLARGKPAFRIGSLSSKVKYTQDHLAHRKIVGVLTHEAKRGQKGAVI